MAQEYISLNEHRELGQIALSKATFQTITKIVINEVKDVKLADSPTPFKSAITCKISEDNLVISVEIKVHSGTNVSNICSKVQKKVFENIEHMSGYSLNQIDVRVVGFIF